MIETVDKLVVVVDADDVAREQTVKQLSAAGFPTRAYPTGESFLGDLQRLDRASYFCVVSELDLPGMAGILLQQQLRASSHVATVVFYAGSARIRQVVRAMRDGAVAVVEKGEGIGSLLDYVEEAVELSRAEYQQTTACAETIGQLRELSSGEQEVLRGIMAGKLNKEIAQELNLSIRTIEQRRREVFRKLHVQHPASLACKVMEVAQAQETRPDLHDEEATRWLTDRRIDGPSSFASWRSRQAYWARRRTSH